MNRPLVILLAVVAGVSGVAIGISAARAGRTKHTLAAAAKMRARNGATSPAAAKAGSGEVIRFASNPQAVPSFSAKDLDGNSVSTADWKGKVVLLNFWATWCPPCREEIPALIALQTRYKDRLEIVGVSLDDSSPEEVKQFAGKVGINYPIVMATRKIVSEFGGVPALPTSFVVNQDSKVVQKHVGLYPSSVYDEEVRSLLGLPVDATIETFQDTGQIFLKNASLATELPDVDLSGLTPEQKQIILKKLNSETCNCGCTLTLAECRINDTTCPISKALAARIVKKVAGGAPASPPKGAISSSTSGPSSKSPKANP